MQKFDLNNELNRIQNKQVKTKSSKLDRFLLSVLVLFACVTVSLNSSYSANIVEMSNTNSYRIRIEVINGLKDNYDFVITQPSFNRVIDSNYKNASLTCNNDDIKYNVQERMIYGKNVNGDVKCTLIFDNKSAKSSININELNRANDNSGVSYYYNALADNNYISINDMMFRIIRINGDGSLRVILNDSIRTSDFGEASYVNSKPLAIAREWYNSRINGLVFAVEEDFDINNYDSRGESFDTDLMDFNTLYFDSVGFISANELNIINKDSKISPDSYLYGNYFTSNGTELGSVWVVRDGGLITTATKNTSLGIRPVINVKYSSLKGDGTLYNPFIIEE